MLKTRKVRHSYVAALEEILKKEQISYVLENGMIEDYNLVRSELTASQFHAFCEKAMCMTESKETGRNVVSLSDYRNRRYKSGCFHILRKDKEHFMNAIVM